MAKKQLLGVNTMIKAKNTTSHRNYNHLHLLPEALGFKAQKVNSYFEATTGKKWSDETLTEFTDLRGYGAVHFDKSIEGRTYTLVMLDEQTGKRPFVLLAGEKVKGSFIPFRVICNLRHHKSTIAKTFEGYKADILSAIKDMQVSKTWIFKALEPSITFANKAFTIRFRERDRNPNNINRTAIVCSQSNYFQLCNAFQSELLINLVDSSKAIKNQRIVIDLYLHLLTA